MTRNLSAVGMIALAAFSTLSADPSAANPERWRAEGWTNTDFSKSHIEWNEIQSGGPPRDGIPSIDNPKFSGVDEVAETLSNREPVIGLNVDGDARAYPLSVMIWHEIVNDNVGGKPLAITYCPLCNSAVVFERTVAGRVLDFGTTGKLRNSDLVMYDRQTETWWQQFTGEAIVGEQLGTNLEVVPARLESFADFKTRHPDGKVLVPNNPSLRDYGRNPYFGYDTLKRPFLYQGALPQGLEPMARVVVVRNGPAAEPVIVTLDAIRKAGQLRAGSTLLTWRAGQASALDQEDVANGRDVGTVGAYRISESGERHPLVYDVTFAFAAHAFHPDVPIQDR